MESPYKRVLLKLSGEALMGPEGYGISPPVLGRIAAEVAETVRTTKVELGIVIGGGNIFRGVSSSAKGMDRATADYVGMLATVMNAVALQDAIESRGVATRTQSAISMSQLAEPYIRRRAIRHLEKGRLIIFAGGTGNPFFSTDTAGVLRALEIEAEVILKATNVDGIFTGDPRKDPSATFIPELTYQEAIVKNYAVMDANAFGLCKANQLPIVVFNINQPGAISRVLQGDRVGTLVR